MWRFTSYCHCTCSFRLSKLFQECTSCPINFAIVDQSTALMLQANITSPLIDSPVWEWLWLSPSHVPSLHFLCRRGMSTNIEHIKWGLDGWFKIRPCSIMIKSWLFFLFSNAAQNKRVIKITFCIVTMMNSAWGEQLFCCFDTHPMRFGICMIQQFQKVSLSVYIQAVWPIWPLPSSGDP